MHKNASDIAGQRFGALTAVSESGRDGRQIKWLCKCDCGNEKSIRGTHLRAGKVRSCGCMKAQLIGKMFTTHGASDTPTFRIWTGMHVRCKNQKRKDWPRYGGAGVKVCERWEKFENFLADMGARPSGQHSIDRYPDTNGNYEPGNCRWATPKEQRSNQRASQARIDRRAATKERHEAVADAVEAGQFWGNRGHGGKHIVEILAVDGSTVTLRRTGLRPAKGGKPGQRPYPIVKARRDRFTGVGQRYHLKPAARAAMVESLMADPREQPQ